MTRAELKNGIICKIGGKSYLFWEAQHCPDKQKYKPASASGDVLSPDKRGFILTADGEYPVYYAEIAQRVAGKRHADIAKA